jgi:hypothetical protein
MIHCVIGLGAALSKLMRNEKTADTEELGVAFESLKNLSD